MTDTHPETETSQVDESKTTRRPRKAKDLGPLHDLLKRGLPGYVDDNDVLDVRAIAKEMGISYQAVYLLFQRGSISKKRIAMVLELSKATKPSQRPSWKSDVKWAPLTMDDFWPFMG